MLDFSYVPACTGVPTYRRDLCVFSLKGLAIVVAVTPLALFLLDLPAIVFGIDRMNEIYRVTPLTLWISLGSGLLSGASTLWLVLFKSDQEPRSAKQWIAILAWGPMSVLFVGWTLNWVSTIVPGETSVIEASAESFRGGGRSLCSRKITLTRRGHTDSDEVCLSEGLGRRVGPADVSVGEHIALTLHTTPLGGTVESIKHLERP